MKPDAGFLEQITRWKKRFLITGAAGLVVSAAGFFLQREIFGISYLVAFLFWGGLTLGAFPLVMLHHLTSGNWGLPVRRLFETALRLVPLLFLFFLPLAALARDLYPWANPDIVAHDTLLRHKALYLNLPGFLGRAAVYFVIWFALASLLYAGSKRYCARPSEALVSRLQGLSGFGLILYGLTVTFASIDWGMSLEPHWYSTIYGLIFMIGQVLSALAFGLFVMTAHAADQPFRTTLTASRSHDLGNLLLAFVMLWAYLSLSQFIIVWSGNLAEEAPWYVRRFSGGWSPVAAFLTIFHFVVPFLALLVRRAKRSFDAMLRLCVLILLMRWVDLFWTLQPAVRDTFGLHWLDVTTTLGLGGFWLAAFLHLMAGEDLSLDQDPLLESPHPGESRHG